MALAIQKRRDTAANWTAVDPIMAEGEEGLEVDTGKTKNGNGVDIWSALPYVSSDVVDDTTPELGGALDCLNKNIDNAKTITFNGEIANAGIDAQTVDWTAGQKQKFTVTAATTISFTPPAGASNLLLKLINPGANITWGTNILWPGGVEPVLSAAGIDILSLYYDGATFYGTVSTKFS